MKRGQEWGGDWYDSEADACAALLARVRKDSHAFFQLVAGPAPTDEAEDAFDTWLADRGCTREDFGAEEWKHDDVPWVAGTLWRRFFVRTLTARRLDSAS